MQVEWTHAAMVLGGVMLGIIIGFVCLTGLPINHEFSLADLVSDPEEAHVHGFGALLFDGIVGNASGCGIVSYNWSGILGMAKFFESDAFGDGVLAIDKEAC